MLRQQQELEVRHKCNARMLGVGLGVLALVVAILIIAVVANVIGSKVPAVEQFTPPSITRGYGIAIKNKNIQPAGDVPNMMVYKDSQYSTCKDYEIQYGGATFQLIDEGKTTLEVRTTYFFDDQIEQTPSKKSSQCAAMVATVVDAIGKYREYHKVIHENRLREGVGYTDQQLRVDFAARTGITGDDLATFQELYDIKVYVDSTKNSHGAMGKVRIGGTPTYIANGKKVGLGNLPPNDSQTALTAIQPATSGSN